MRFPELKLNVGACIYCGETSLPLTREHVLPRGLGGNVPPEGFKSALVLQKATCESCRLITSQVEASCLRSNFNYARARLGLKRKDRAEDRLQTFIEMPDGSKGYREVASDDVMAGIIIPSYREAGALTGRPLTSNEPCPCDYHITITAPGRGDVYEQSARAGIDTQADARMFARMLAKIALGVAVARFGLNAFEPTVRNFILKNPNECGYWVGGFSGTQRVESGYWGHRIHTYTKQTGADTFIVVEIQLFAEFVAPSNYVVVGRTLGDISISYFPTQEINWKGMRRQSKENVRQMEISRGTGKPIVLKMETLSDPDASQLLLRHKGEIIGLPGQPLTVTIRKPRSKKDPKRGPLTNSEMSSFKVTFTFARPGEEVAPNRTLSTAELITGTSFLRIRRSDDPTPSEAPLKYPVRAEQMVVNIEQAVNSSGFIHQVTVSPIKAADFSMAEQIARRIILPSLSWYSAHSDVPIFIYQVDTENIETYDYMIHRAAKPFNPVVFPKGFRVLDPDKELSAYTSVYREALNSNSHIYQFLCFYKIVNGITNRRKRTASRTKMKVVVERLPDDEEGIISLLQALFPYHIRDWDILESEFVFKRELWGKEVTEIIDLKLRPLRTEIAQGFSDDAPEIPWSLDEHLKYEEVAERLPLLKSIARWMMKNEFPGTSDKVRSERFASHSQGCHQPSQ